MKPKKLIAVLLIVIAFEVFLGIGFMLSTSMKKTITKQVFVEKPVVVFKTPNCSYERKVSVFGVGVHEDNKTGELILITLAIKPGKGRVFFETTYKAYGYDLQESIPFIRAVSERISNSSLEDYDLYISMSGQASIIEGTSGSSAIAVGLIALMLNKSVNESITLTGGIDEKGKMLPISGLNVKIKTAEELGMEKILIPSQQCDEVKANYSIEVECVDSVAEAAQEMLI